MRSLVAKGDECKGGKLSKDRPTVLLCGSASGEKLMPLVIGRSTNPRCFKRGHMTSLRVTYESNNKACMTGELFAAWMRRVDNRMRRQNRPILLFLDNCGAHPHMELENVKVVFLPPNTTSKLQPMDAGIIQNTLSSWWTQTASDVAKKVTVLDAILWLIGNDQQVLPEVRVF